MNTKQSRALGVAALTTLGLATGLYAGTRRPDTLTDAQIKQVGAKNARMTDLSLKILNERQKISGIKFDKVTPAYVYLDSETGLSNLSYTTDSKGKNSLSDGTNIVVEYKGKEFVLIMPREYLEVGISDKSASERMIQKADFRAWTLGKTDGKTHIARVTSESYEISKALGKRPATTPQVKPVGKTL